MDAKLENEYSGDEIWSHFAETAKKESIPLILIQTMTY